MVGASGISHSDNVQAGIPELVDSLDGVRLGADGADLQTASHQLRFSWHQRLTCGSVSYDGGSAVVLGGLVGGVKLGEPVDSTSELEVVESCSSHLFFRLDLEGGDGYSGVGVKLVYGFIREGDGGLGSFCSFAVGKEEEANVGFWLRLRMGELGQGAKRVPNRSGLGKSLCTTRARLLVSFAGRARSVDVLGDGPKSARKEDRESRDGDQESRKEGSGL